MSWFKKKALSTDNEKQIYERFQAEEHKKVVAAQAQREVDALRERAKERAKPISQRFLEKAQRLGGSLSDTMKASTERGGNPGFKLPSFTQRTKVARRQRPKRMRGAYSARQPLMAERMGLTGDTGMTSTLMGGNMSMGLTASRFEGKKKPDKLWWL